jgi:RNA polymerase sigma factor (sigma-70 family)
MRQFLSNPTDAFSAPNPKEQPVGSIVERDHIWNQLTQDQYDAYYRMAWNVAYLIVGHPLEADIVADKVMAALDTRVHPSSTSEIERHLRVLARSRALDCLASPMHRFRMKCGSLLLQADEEEYESVPASQCSIGAEEEFFYEEDRELFAQHFAQALSRLNDLQRACFVLRFVEHIKPEEIAEMLKVPVDTVYTQAYRARNRVAKLLTDRRKHMSSSDREEGGFPCKQALP